MMKYDVAIIGAGAAGIEAALMASRAGLSTALISDLPIGGRTAFADMIPARIWRETGRILQQNYNLTGILPFENRPTIGEVKANIEAAGDDWSIFEKRNLEQLGVTFFEGTALITAPHVLSVNLHDQNPQSITARYIIAATGTTPAPIHGIAPDRDHIIYPKQFKSLYTYPETVLVIGSDTSACEYASALSDLLIDVTLITDKPQIVSGLDNQIAEELQQELHARGITIALNQTVESTMIRGKSVVAVTTNERTFTAHLVVLFPHRNRDYSFLGNNSPQFERNASDSIIVTNQGKTSQAWFYIIGDLTGKYSIGHARLSAQRAIESISAELAGELPRPVFNNPIPQIVFTSPPAAQVGEIPQQGTRILHYYFSQIPLTRIRQIGGHLKLWVTRMGKIEAAAMFGEGIEEILPVISLAISMGISFSDLTRLPIYSPTISELLTVPPFKTEVQDGY